MIRSTIAKAVSSEAATLQESRLLRLCHGCSDLERHPTIMQKTTYQWGIHLLTFESWNLETLHFPPNLRDWLRNSCSEVVARVYLPILGSAHRLREGSPYLVDQH